MEYQILRAWTCVGVMDNNLKLEIGDPSSNFSRDSSIRLENIWMSQFSPPDMGCLLDLVFVNHFYLHKIYRIYNYFPDLNNI